MCGVCGKGRHSSFKVYVVWVLVYGKGRRSLFKVCVGKELLCIGLGYCVVLVYGRVHTRHSRCVWCVLVRVDVHHSRCVWV